MDEARRVLKETFGFDNFRLSQEKVIERLLVRNANALVLYPTGGGKSLCYQIPGLCLEGLTLVISPLIALMKDQVDALKRRGVPAASLDSSLGLQETCAVKDSIRDGSLKILYIAPERLNNESFVEMMRYVKISLLAIDESHCISQWGASFRPEYLKIARFAEEFAVQRILCLTATATPGIASDICTSFKIDENDGVFRTPVYRSNLIFLVRTASNFYEKILKIKPILQNRKGPVIVYVTTRKQAEQAANALGAEQIPAEIYHAGLDPEERKRVQNLFMEGENIIVIATIAFGMGIDKENIRHVIHLYMPKTLENFSQEVGRAGRDGLPATCYLFLSAPDIPTLEGFCRGDTCNKLSLQPWLHEVARKQLDSDGILSFNLNEQQKDYDIRANVLNLLYAELELTYGYIRATTPLYQIYNLTPRSPEAFELMARDTSPAARAAFMGLQKIKSKTRLAWKIDVVASATDEWPRERLAAQITRWESNGWVDVTGAQVRARFRVLKPLPKTMKEQALIVDKMHDDMVSREEEEISRLEKVIEFATQPKSYYLLSLVFGTSIVLAQKGLSHSLASYFGDTTAVPNDGMCGHCNYCETRSPVVFDSSASTVASPLLLEAILRMCPFRDDPLILTRIAFGITSPRITVNKWSGSNPLFGSMEHVEWGVLLDAFQKVCLLEDNQSGGSVPKKKAAAAGTKRASSTASDAETSAAGGSGGGTRAKRVKFKN
ncbi:ATP-dependent DNA helicase [Clavulina sp. PMI_390]|nr:ATP-dependent DNA helicase [Clavulina sp. PMI_390]